MLVILPLRMAPPVAIVASCEEAGSLCQRPKSLAKLGAIQWVAGQQGARRTHKPGQQREEASDKRRPHDGPSRTNPTSTRVIRQAGTL